MALGTAEAERQPPSKVARWSREDDVEVLGASGPAAELGDVADRILKSLQDMRYVRPGEGRSVALAERDLEFLCEKTRLIFHEQPVFLDVDAPMRVAGDVHGQFFDLLRLFEFGGSPEYQNYLFLGDYVDRGRNSIECVALLFAYKVLFPNNFFLLRGNHEDSKINKLYGFYDECKRRYNMKLWKTFGDAFNVMPVCARLASRILCMHGGLSPQLQSLDQLMEIKRPSDVPEAGLLCDLLWSDPSPDINDWGDSDRGVSYTFGAQALEKFLKKHDLDLIARAHQVVQDGYEFFGGRKLVTVFSAPNYCREFDNAGALMIINEELVCSFKVLKPEKSPPGVFS